MHTRDIYLKPSKYYISLCVVLLLGSIASIFYLNLKGWLTLLMLFLTFWYAMYVIKSYATNHALQKVCALGDGMWMLTTKQKSYIAHLCGDSTVTPFFCVLRLAIPGKRCRYTCVIFRDTQDAQTYRRLLVELYATKKIL